MIKFFRKIRQNLLSEGKTVKYFKYAIGEIILVVIGILIAIQVNNLNTKRINHAKELEYIIKLERDLNNQLQIINRNIAGEIRIFNNLSQLANIYGENQKFNFEKEVRFLYPSILDRYTFTVSNPTYEELLSTGNIDLIRNSLLKDSLVEYYQSLELAKQIFQKNNDRNDNISYSKLLSTIEAFGASEMNLVDGGINSTFIGYESPAHLVQFIEENLSLPENELELLNLIRLRTLMASNHVLRLKEFKTKTEALINALKE